MMFYLGSQLLENCRQQESTISEVMIAQECRQFSQSRSDVQERMHHQWLVMKNGIHQAMTQHLVTMGGLIGGEGKKLLHHQNTGSSLSGPVTTKAMAYAMGLLEVNASMGIIVAAPTGGSCGILPGTLKALQEAYN